jgi:protein TonB
MKDCFVTEETPSNYGFGQAALRLAPLFRMRPMTGDGVISTVGASVVIPIGFRLPRS